jgi:hypothetical protein
VAPTGEERSYFGRTATTVRGKYVDGVSRIRLVLATYGLDGLIVALALAGAVGTALRRDPYRPDDLRLGFEAAAIAVMVLTFAAASPGPLCGPRCDVAAHAS